MEGICLPSESKDYKLSKMYFFITVSLKMAKLEEIKVETKVQIFINEVFELVYAYSNTCTFTQ